MTVRHDKDRHTTDRLDTVVTLLGTDTNIRRCSEHVIVYQKIHIGVFLGSSNFSVPFHNEEISN